jgi:hypothetical protein
MVYAGNEHLTPQLHVLLANEREEEEEEEEEEENGNCGILLTAS